MYKHHSLEEKKEIIRLYLSGVCMVELMSRFHVRDHYLYILFGRYKKYGIEGLESYKGKHITAELKQSVILEYEKDVLPLWQICVEYDVSYASVCRWVQQYKRGGYTELLRHCSRGRQRKAMGRPKKKEPQTELEKLQARVRWLEAENALLKKAKALMEEEESRLRGSGQKPSNH
jgi:transposase-like protein